MKSLKEIKLQLVKRYYLLRRDKKIDARKINYFREKET